MTPAEQVKEIRAVTGLSQKKFAEKTGIPLRTLISWETGDRKPPAYTTRLLALAVQNLKEEYKCY